MKTINIKEEAEFQAWIDEWESNNSNDSESAYYDAKGYTDSKCAEMEQNNYLSRRHRKDVKYGNKSSKQYR